MMKIYFCIGNKVLLMERKFNLEERLIDLASNIIDISEALPNTVAGNHLAGQLVRSGTAPALQYGEAQAAESRQDFIHKMKVALKELRETYNCSRIIKKKNWYDLSRTETVLNENNQLISIFVKSIETARKNLKKDVQKRE
jgi:four helix bundle protein